MTNWAWWVRSLFGRRVWWRRLSDLKASQLKLRLFRAYVLVIALLPSGRRRTGLEAWLANDLPRQFTGRLLAVDEAVARAWGRYICCSIRFLAKDPGIRDAAFFRIHPLPRSMPATHGEYRDGAQADARQCCRTSKSRLRYDRSRA